MFIEGYAPSLSTESLVALREALRTDDRRLMQGGTTTPPPLMAVMDWPIEAACAIGFCAMADGAKTVGETEEVFARLCYEADQRLGEPAACRYFLTWTDDTPRDEMRRELLVVVAEVLKGREVAAEQAA